MPFVSETADEAIIDTCVGNLSSAFRGTLEVDCMLTRSIRYRLEFKIKYA